MAYNLQAIINQNLSNTTNQFERLGGISSNVTNYNTNGYKASSFDQMLSETGYVTNKSRVDYSDGPLVKTGHEFDIAITGKGFVPVSSKTGEIGYIRDGSLQIGEEGYLVTLDGSLVGDGIKIPPNHAHLSIKPDGEVYILTNDNEMEEFVGKIPLVVFPNVNGMIQGDGNKFYKTEESGEPLLLKDHEKIVQGSLEKSNVDIYDNVTVMLRINASMISSFKLLKVADDMYNKSINLRQ